MLHPILHVTLRLVVFEIFAVKIETLCPGPIYHHAKGHADRCHRCRDICEQTETKIDRYTDTIRADFNIRQNARILAYERCVG